MTDTTTQPKQPFIYYSDLLTSKQQSNLSVSAKLLYACAWNFMAHKDATEIYIKNEKASRIARVTVGHLPLVHAELEQAGILRIVPDHLPVTAEDARSKYVFICDEPVEAN